MESTVPSLKIVVIRIRFEDPLAKLSLFLLL